MSNPAIDLRPITPADQTWVQTTLVEHWGSTLVVSHGVQHRADGLPGWIAWQGEERKGLATYHINGQECELVTLNALQEGLGIGTALIDKTIARAEQVGCYRLWLVTTNDNLSSLRFYQKRGFVLAALRPGAVEQARQIKPEIPQIGLDGIPLRDELELEIVLKNGKERSWGEFSPF